MTIAIQDLQSKVRISPSDVIKLSKAVLRHQRIADAELNIVFVNHQKMRSLNWKYLGRNYATDVLAFDLSDQKMPKNKPSALFGDIIISTDAAIKSIRALSSTLQEELALYMIHGILHLQGYDDHSREDAKLMRAQERKIIDCLASKIKSIAQLRGR